MWWLLILGWQQDALRVERAVITIGAQQITCVPNQVVDLPPMPANTRAQTMAVVFDLELVADRQEWARLQSARKIPVVFKWFRFSGARMFITSVVQDSNANQPTSFVRTASGATVYRANTYNERITSGTWVIMPVYADNTPIVINGRELSYQFRAP
jgi:hypothetical protein